MRFQYWLALSLSASIATPVWAQQDPAPQAEPSPEADDENGELPDNEEYEADIVVTGERLPGAAIGGSEPEVQLGPRDIRAYGASNVAELIDALSPLTGSTRGRGGGGPVILLNGRRISGFGEIRDLPPEAIMRVDILPEEVALNYGYRADQRVVNIVLRPRFRALTVELEDRFATAGGRSIAEVDANWLRLNRNGRWSLDVEYQRSSALLESERDVIEAPASPPFDLAGNIGASPFAADAEIDPALSAIVGEPVTVAAVPVSAAGTAPALVDFAAGANRPNVTDTGRFRTLLPQTDRLELGGTVNRIIFGDVSATANARLELNESQSRLGLPTARLLLPAANPFSPFGEDVSLFRFVDAGPLLREGEGKTAHLGLGLNGELAPWRWTVTANLDHVRNLTRTDTGVDPAALQARLDALDSTLNPFAALPAELVATQPEDRARSTAQSTDAQLVANGPLVGLSAGPLRASVRVGGDVRSLESETTRGGLVQPRDLSRRRAAGQANLDLPIASRRMEVLSELGDLSANVHAEVEHLSDFGALTTFGMGLRWSPFEPLDLAVSVTDEDGAPTMQQLGDAILLTPNVRVFDFVRGETVDIARLEGGNPALRADNRREINLRASLRPFDDKDLSIIANYTDSRTVRPIAAFPTATAEIEAAFPERFVRGADGRLLQIDARPVNFARAEREELRWGFNLSLPFGPQGPTPEQRAAFRERMRALREQRREGAPEQGSGAERTRRNGGGARQRGGFGGRGVGGRGFGRFGFGGPPGGGRIQLSLHHQWRFEDRILIRPGVPELDFLNGSAAGSTGGRPRHELQLRSGAYRDGVGARVGVDWRSGTTVKGGSGNAGDLFFSDLATVNLQLFADLSQQRGLVRRHRWLRGMRVSFEIDNLFDSRPQVRDAFGVTPIGYQPALLDPLGRNVRISLRKLFF